jgi:hypothetical protein
MSKKFCVTKFDFFVENRVGKYAVTVEMGISEVAIIFKHAF